MHLGKSTTMEYKSKTSNLLSAASPLQNFEFDFGLGNGGPAKGRTLGSLKDGKSQQNTSGGATQTAKTNFSAATPSWMPSVPSKSEGAMGTKVSSVPTTASKTPWTHVPAPGMSSLSSAPMSNSWSTTPAASAGLVASNSDSLSDLWKNSATFTKKTTTGSASISKSIFSGSSRGTSGSLQPPSTSLGTFSLNLNANQSQKSGSMSLKPNSEMPGSDPFASLTGPAPISLGSMKKAKEATILGGAAVRSPPPVVSTPSTNDGFLFDMGDVQSALGTPPIEISSAGAGQVPNLPEMDSKGTTTVRLKAQTVTVEVSEVNGVGDQEMFPPSADLSDPFGNVFGAGAPSYQPTFDNVGDDFDDFQTASQVPQTSFPEDDDFTPFQQVPPSGFSNLHTSENATSPAPVDPFSHSDNLFADPFGSTSGPAISQSPSFQETSFNSADPFASSFGSAAETGVPTSASFETSDPFAALFNNPPSSSTQVKTPAETGNGPSPAVPVDPLEALMMGIKPQNVPSSSPPPVSSNGGGDSWGVSWGESESHETTRELEGLGPPPAGSTAASALKRASEFVRGGQFADAIKWLMWAEQLCQNSGDLSAMVEILSTRATCYREAGEMKKAVADCTLVLELLPGNTVVLMQRASLFEGMEKYKQGIEDLREVTRLDPGNRQAIIILSRLNKALAANS